MEFRPCIDIHNGCVKQIVGGTLLDRKNRAEENFVSQYDASFYAKMYRDLGIGGGHVILLNKRDSVYFEKTKEQALSALRSWPSGLQVGGGIDDENAEEYLNAGASHVIVTSYLIENGKISMDRLKTICDKVGKEHLVIDLSCRRVSCEQGKYRIVADRWQKDTEDCLDLKLMDELAKYCDEFLIHGVDVEGKAGGIDCELVRMLGKHTGNAVTYAGGVHNFHDLELIKKYGNNRVNVTIGSALDLFGGTMKLTDVLNKIYGQKKNQS